MLKTIKTKTMRVAVAGALLVAGGTGLASSHAKPSVPVVKGAKTLSTHQKRIAGKDKGVVADKYGYLWFYHHHGVSRHIWHRVYENEFGYFYYEDGRRVPLVIY